MERFKPYETPFGCLQKFVLSLPFNTPPTIRDGRVQELISTNRFKSTSRVCFANCSAITASLKLTKISNQQNFAIKTYTFFESYYIVPNIMRRIHSCWGIHLSSLHIREKYCIMGFC